MLLNTLALEHTLNKQMLGDNAKHASLRTYFTKQMIGDIAEHASLRTYSQQTNNR